MAGRIPLDVVSTSRESDGSVTVVVSTPVALSERVKRAARLRARRELSHGLQRSSRVVRITPTPGAVQIVVNVSRNES